jgi:patatin-like phospholipase/acyl hydrolase
LGASKKRLVIPSFNIGDNDVYVFRTAHLSRLRRDYKVPAWHVGMATSAAPTYFAAHRLPDSSRLIDGGVWANNPSMVALTEVVGKPHLAVPMDQVRLLSVGTVSAFRGRREELDHGGLWQWKKAAVSVIMDASSIGVTNQARALLGENFYRISAQGVDGDVQLDNTRSIDGLIAAAQHVSRSHMPAIAETFMSHKAAPFTPFYTP